MNVLLACEESQRECSAFRAKGHNAFSCDIIECSGGHPEWHIMQDVLPLLNGNCTFRTMDGIEHTIEGKWDLIIAHPPCTFMSKAGARWMYKDGKLNTERLKKGMEAKSFFMACLTADCPRICVENPRPLKIIGLPKHSQIVHPYFFGDAFSKETLLWLIGLEQLTPTQMIDVFVPYCPSNTSKFAHGGKGSKGCARTARDRSKTPFGLSAAMAEQWG